MEFTEIHDDVINAVAHQVFGQDVLDCREIRPASEGGVPRVVGCNNNLTYIVTVRDVKKKCVFRFSRARRENRYEKEAETYALIAKQTEIPTPRIYDIDISCSLAPTPFMVMDYVEGENWWFLSHPQNANTDQSDKTEIFWKVGQAYAALHNIQRKAEDPNVGKRKLLSRLEQLRAIVMDGQYSIEMAKLDSCGETIEQDEHLRLETESLLKADADLTLKRESGNWKVSAICDLEWVDFGDPYMDLASLCHFPRPIWKIEEVLTFDTNNSKYPRHFFDAYKETREFDHNRLSRLATYYQFYSMCSVTDQIYWEHKRDAMKAREPVYTRVVDAIASGLE